MNPFDDFHAGQVSHSRHTHDQKASHSDYDDSTANDYFDDISKIEYHPEVAVTDLVVTGRNNIDKIDDNMRPADMIDSVDEDGYRPILIRRRVIRFSCQKATICCLILLVFMYVIIAIGQESRSI